MTKINKHLPFVIPLISLIFGVFWQSFLQTNTIILLMPIILILFILLRSTTKDLTTYFYPNSKSFLMQDLSAPIEESKNKKTYTLIYILFLFSGAFLLQHKIDQNEQFFQSVKNRKLKITAMVLNIENEQNNFFKQTIKLKTEHGNLICFSPIKQKLQVDDKIEIENIEIKKSKIKDNKTGKPTFYDYLLKENILATIFFSKETEIKILNIPKFSITRWIKQKKETIYKKLKQKISTLSFSYFAPIFLGNKNNTYSFELKEKFNTWGLTHYLARSGLHIIIFILILGFFLKYIPVPIIYKTLFLILACLIYHLFSWPSVSYYRAIYLFLLYQGAKLLNKQTSFLHLFCLIAISILLFNPMQLFFLDFQLSFALTFSLAWLSFSNLT